MHKGSHPLCTGPSFCFPHSLVPDLHMGQMVSQLFLLAKRTAERNTLIFILYCCVVRKSDVFGLVQDHIW